MEIPSFLKVNVIPVNDPPYIHFDPSLNVTVSIPHESRTHTVRYFVGSDKALLLPDSTVVDDVDSSVAWEVFISMSRKLPGDHLGIDVDLAEDLNLTVSIARDDEGLVNAFWIHGRAAFVDYKRVCCMVSICSLLL